MENRHSSVLDFRLITCEITLKRLDKEILHWTIIAIWTTLLFTTANFIGKTGLEEVFMPTWGQFNW